MHDYTQRVENIKNSVENDYASAQCPRMGTPLYFHKGSKFFSLKDILCINALYGMYFM